MRSQSIGKTSIFFLFAALVVSCGSGMRDGQRVYSDPEVAVSEMLAAMEGDQMGDLTEIFGEPHRDVLFEPGNEDALEERLEIVERARVKHHLASVSPDEMELLVGSDDWPFPIVLIREDGKWRFDSESGIEEIHDRRIGENELRTIRVMRVYPEAQEEYARRDRDGNGFKEFAQRLRSTPGNKDGLYWTVEEGSDEKLSPFGPLVAESREELEGTKPGDPFMGYFYRILTRQGENQRAGAFDYIVNGHMIAGFALVAYPAEYGESGVMTFVVNQDGVVYQKDSGAWVRTDTFDPDETWEVVPE